MAGTTTAAAASGGGAELRWRSLHKLLVHRETLRCAETRCVACCYKIALYSRPGLLPNVRPELCPRMASASPPAGRVGLYDAGKLARVLTVGDGNFSYSLALGKALAPRVEVVATSHESRETVVETYPDGARILDELAAMDKVTVLHGVDATDAQQMHALGQFDRVIWNFPCVRAPRGEDGQNQEMEVNKKLLADFFAHVARMLTPGGEVHVTHKTKPPFGQWGIEAIAEASGLRHSASVIFDRCLYPGYSNKKVLSKGSFPIWDSQTFVFLPASVEEGESAEQQGTEDEKQLDGEKSEVQNPASDEILVPVTMPLLQKLYVLLTPSLDDKYGGKKKHKKKDTVLLGAKRKLTVVDPSADKGPEAPDSKRPAPGSKRTGDAGKKRRETVKRGETPGRQRKKKRRN